MSGYLCSVTTDGWTACLRPAAYRTPDGRWLCTIHAGPAIMDRHGPSEAARAPVEAVPPSGGPDLPPDDPEAPTATVADYDALHDDDRAAGHPDDWDDDSPEPTRPAVVELVPLRCACDLGRATIPRCPCCGGRLSGGDS